MTSSSSLASCAVLIRSVGMGRAADTPIRIVPRLAALEKTGAVLGNFPDLIPHKPVRKHPTNRTLRPSMAHGERRREAARPDSRRESNGDYGDSLCRPYGWPVPPQGRF